MPNSTLSNTQILSLLRQRVGEEWKVWGNTQFIRKEKPERINVELCAPVDPGAYLFTREEVLALLGDPEAEEDKELRRACYEFVD